MYSGAEILTAITGNAATLDTVMPIYTGGSVKTMCRRRPIGSIISGGGGAVVNGDVAVHPLPAPVAVTSVRVPLVYTVRVQRTLGC